MVSAVCRRHVVSDQSLDTIRRRTLGSPGVGTEKNPIVQTRAPMSPLIMATPLLRQYGHLPSVHERTADRYSCSETSRQFPRDEVERKVT